MRLLLFSIFFPVFLSSQQLPDSAAAARAGVKQLVIMRCEQGQKDDTESVYFFDRKWKSKTEIQNVNNAPSKLQHTFYDSAGRITFMGGSGDFRHRCANDTVGTLFHYDAQGRLIHQKHFTCDKGDLNTWFCYDSAGNKVLEYTDVRGDRMDSRIEFQFNKAGQLIAQTNWWAIHPDSSVRDSADYIAAEIKYSYGANGLITEAFATDKMHYLYIPLFAWKSPDAEPRETASEVRFRYIYIY